MNSAEPAGTLLVYTKLWSNLEQLASNFLSNWGVDYSRTMSESFSDTIYTSFGTAFEGATLSLRYGCAIWNKWHAMTTPPTSPIPDNTNPAPCIV